MLHSTHSRSCVSRREQDLYALSSPRLLMPAPVCSPQIVMTPTQHRRCGRVAIITALLLGMLTAIRAADAGSVAADAPALAGKLEEIEGTEVVWQLPSKLPVKGLLLAFHGCGHAATDWWPKGLECPTCIGLPEEVLITKTVLARGYGVLAISSRDRHNRRCWALPQNPQSRTVDVRSVEAVLGVLLKRQDLKDVPLYALGASSGGAFALTIARYVPLSAVCSQIMSLPARWYTSFLEQPAISSKGGGLGQPPVLFVHMPRDEHVAARVAESVEIRHQLGLMTHVIEVKPQPLTPALLSRIPELTAGTARQVISLLKSHGLVDWSGMLTKNPRHTRWQSIVRQSSIPGASSWNLTPDQSGLSELLNMAWAEHEIVADPTTQMLDWFEKQPVIVGAAD